MLLSRLLVIYRFSRQCHILRSLQFQMIDEVTGPGLINPRDTCYVHVIVQLFFHILPLRLIIQLDAEPPQTQ
jgi:hypothetical protein